MDTKIKDWLAILRKERQLLIDKTKSGTYMAMAIIIPTLFAVYFFVLNREPIILPGTLLQDTIAIILYAIIVVGSLAILYFVFINYFRYQNIEKIVDLILSNEIKKEDDFFTIYKQKLEVKSINGDKNEKTEEVVHRG